MGAQVLRVATIALVLFGIADLVIPSHVEGTKALGNTITSLWRTTANGALGTTS